ncbi:phosphocholine-specific phospholipase C [Actinophytocola sp.]|uniref:phosphocholine-specific phospholipase C n=1 Tax=Actinophytocola sp. TaxID=1872138 RepID=UPI002D387E01|nr:phospholipase C, phosphocholine-specific [Actinophytocola sp.]HYQ65370.1 phospholipase C, phosphocholine-specific [Actinophytocola sp.]
MSETTGLNRRRFLQLAGATATFTALSDSISAAAAVPAHRRTGTIRDVEHIVVLMQENRSFDHYFGALRGVRGFGDPRPVSLPSGRSVWHQSDGTRDVLPFRPAADDLGLQFIQDLNHDWRGGQLALNGGRYDQWIPAKTPTTMAYLTREDIPFHYALADAFTVCDAYHCSFIGSTDPNRYYLWTGYTGNDGAGGGPVLGNDEAGYGWTTYPERLERAGVSWKIYQDVGDGLDANGSWGWTNDAYIGNYGDNSLLYFNSYRDAQPGNPLYDKARTGTNAKAGQGFFDILEADVRADRLPQISWIAAPEAFTEHPNWPANYGAWYVAQVLDALTSNPEVWSKTALFITYDENDGFFDHVVPPMPPLSPAHGRSTVEVGPDLYPGDAGHVPGPYGLGQRVPMLVVSPWSKGGFVCSETFDHTSVIRFMEQRFGVREPNISPWRRAVCGDLTSAFDFGQRDPRPARLPGTGGYEPPDRDRHPDYVPPVPADPKLPVQERGRRHTRPLGYRPFVDAHVARSAVTLTFGTGPAAGGAFHVTSANRTDGPWTYTTEAGKTVTDTWTGPYDLTVFGPNGFLRAFAGTAPVAEVTARHDGRRSALTLTLHNTSDTTVKLTVTSAYGGQRTYTLHHNATFTHTIDLDHSDRWYDVTVTCDKDRTFRRRLAGHVENGRPGLSDPAILTH